MHIENFPTSESAKNMMSYITGNGFYDDSWVGKWIFQVMGMEMDDARAIIEDLPNQAFPETATWAMGYHEEKFGLPIREYIPLEERRQAVLAKRNRSTPSSPWKMEQIIKDITGQEVHVTDINEPGNTLPHPNVFEILIKGETPLDICAVKSRVDKMKQSHTTYAIYAYCEVGINVDTTPKSYKSIYDLCGTLPIISLALSVDTPDVVIEEILEAYRSILISTGEEVAGIEPVTSVLVSLSNAELKIIETTLHEKYANLYSGEEDAGNIPLSSTRLSAQNESLSMRTDDKEYMTYFRMCGEDL